MTMKLPCAVVRDLLPLYAEKMTESETQALVEEHLRGCPECQRRYTEIEAGTCAPVDTSAPLRSLKKEIRRRRWLSAVAAALLVFVAVFVFFTHENRLEPVPWRSSLVEVVGVEARPQDEVFEDDDATDPAGATVDALVLKVDGTINGMQESAFEDEDGARTVILQGWSSEPDRGNLIPDYNELVLCPVPDRVLYSAGDRQELLWGEWSNGGVEVLPRLALTYYLIIAAGLALVTGAAWVLLRKRSVARIIRQVFFAPAAYVIAHFLIEGIRGESFFLQRDLLSIVIVAAALYALFSIAWQIRRRQKIAA